MDMNQAAGVPRNVLEAEMRFVDREGWYTVGGVRYSTMHEAGIMRRRCAEWECGSDASWDGVTQ